MAICEEYKKDPNVEYCEPNYIAKVYYTPTDPRYPEQWAHQNTQAELGWDIQRGNSNIVIAVVDTGIAYNHEDLSANIWHDGAGNPGKDFVDIDIAAYWQEGFELIEQEDYTGVDNDPSDYFGHGTHVAGIAGAVADNGKGIAGVCHSCRLMPVRAGFAIRYYGEDYGMLEEDDIVNAIQYAADEGADVINMSFGGTYSEIERLAIDYAYAAGVVLIAAAGNDGRTQKKYNYPAANEHVLAVVATALSDAKAFYSSFGSWISVAAPGGDSREGYQILSTVPMVGTLSDPSGYRVLQGTSMASPYVAGLAALVLSQQSTYSNEDVRRTILLSSDDLGDAGKDWLYGFGRVNVFQALSAVLQGPQPFLYVTLAQVFDANGNDIGFPASGGGASLVVTLKNEWVDVRNVSGTLTSKDGCVAILQNQGIFGDILSGQSSNNMSTPFRIRLSQSCPPTVNFTLRLSGANQYQRDIGFSVSKKQLIYSATDEIGVPVVLKDVNHDGKTEILVTSINGYIHLFDQLGHSLPGWPKPFPDTSGIVPENPSITVPPFWDLLSKNAPAIADLDNDGEDEIIAKGTGRIYIWKGNSLVAEPSLQINLPDEAVITNATAGSPVVADLDGDGYKEIIVGYNSRLYVFRHDGSMNPAWAWPVEFFEGLTAHGATPAVGDLDGDGDLEVVFVCDYKLNGDKNYSYVGVWHHDGSVFNANWPKLSLPPAMWCYGPSPVLADIDKDGLLDIIAPTAMAINVFDAQGQPKYNWPQSQERVIQFVAVGDLNNDGYLELATGSSGVGFPNTYLYTYDGKRIWDIRGRHYSNYFDIWAPTIGDVNGDGYAEYVVAEGFIPGLVLGPWFGGGWIQARNYAGTNANGEWPKNLYTGAPIAALDDINKDGMAEMVFADQDGQVYKYSLGVSYNWRTTFWPQFQHDAQHTGCYIHVNRPPTINSIGNKAVNVNSNLTFTVTATDSDNDRISLYIGKDTILPGVFSFSPASGIGSVSSTFSWKPTATGSFPVTFFASDGRSLAKQNITITVKTTTACFLQGTPILMSDGTFKPIEKVKVGDRVMAFDEKTKELKIDKVKKVFRHQASEYLIVNKDLKVTDNHPVYSNGKWKEMGSLKVGDSLVKSDGSSLNITSITQVWHKTKVYNLEVNPYHTYVAGGIVVHNKAAPPKAVN